MLALKIPLANGRFITNALFELSDSTYRGINPFTNAMKIIQIWNYLKTWSAAGPSRIFKW
jgi:hypothetical protein